MIVFRCNPETSHLGEPHRAKACRCAHPWVADGGCEKCGRWTAHTIDVTWRDQARRLRGGTWAGQAPRVSADSREFRSPVYRRLAELGV